MTNKTMIQSALSMSLYDKITDLRRKIEQLSDNTQSGITNSTVTQVFEQYLYKTEDASFHLPSFPSLRAMVKQIKTSTDGDQYALKSIQTDIRLCESTIRHEIIKNLYDLCKIINTHPDVFIKRLAVLMNDRIDEITLSLSHDCYLAPYIPEHLAEIQVWLDQLTEQVYDTQLTEILHMQFETVKYLFSLMQ